MKNTFHFILQDVNIGLPDSVKADIKDVHIGTLEIKVDSDMPEKELAMYIGLVGNILKKANIV